MIPIKEYAFAIYDERLRLPADALSRIAVIKTEYHIRLSASPHREVGRDSYTFGFPVGLNGPDYMKTVGGEYRR